MLVTVETEEGRGWVRFTVPTIAAMLMTLMEKAMMQGTRVGSCTFANHV